MVKKIWLLGKKRILAGIMRQPANVSTIQLARIPDKKTLLLALILMTIIISTYIVVSSNYIAQIKLENPGGNTIEIQLKPSAQ
jgi:hypothetical protein